VHGIIAFLSLLLLGLTSAPHPDSLSSSRLTVDDRGAELTVRCQLLSLLEVIDGLDEDSDGSVTARELAAKRSRIIEYVVEHYRVYAAKDAATPLEPRLATVQLLPPDLTLAPRLRDWADVRMEFRSPEPITEVRLEMTLFFTTSPAHIDITTIEWPDGRSDVHTMDRNSPEAVSSARRAGTFGAFWVLGWKHILSGWDHLGFVLALFLGARGLRGLLGVVTSFTVAHSITLALSALGVVRLAPYSDSIEAIVALSIAYVAIDNLIHAQRSRSPWIEAFVFGLIHGLGFASFLGQSLVGERAVGLALFSFNVGVESGQIAVVLGLTLLCAWLPGARATDDPHLAPPWLRRAGSVAVALLGLYWFFERI